MDLHTQEAFAAPAEGSREHWRSIVLFGRNVASYKFALAKSLLEVAITQREVVRLDELAEPFARHICEHLARVDRQGTFAHSRFLDACRYYNAGRITADELRDATTLLGFNNVIDAFHVVGSGDVPTRFFRDERSTTGGIRLTDRLFELTSEHQVGELTQEAEARWRLVEHAWESKAQGDHARVLYDAPREVLVPALLGRRRSITEIRPALNGYQKGHCFYCFAPLRWTVTDHSADTAADVDHFIPHVLMTRGLPVDLDLPWNLVLSCVTCNRGPAGKFASLPDRRYLERLHRRNEFLIASNHPLKDTLIAATSRDATARRRFLDQVMSAALPLADTRAGWLAAEEQPRRF